MLNFFDFIDSNHPPPPSTQVSGSAKKREYIRHGTQTLIASFDVASGQVAQAIVGDTRYLSDYLSHVQQLIASDPAAIKWHLVMDCLNTHQSEFLVRFVAEVEGQGIDLGVKSKSGILKSMLSSICLLE